MPLPDASGHFGIFGGRYVPETLMKVLDELVREYRRFQADLSFRKELAELLKQLSRCDNPHTCPHGRPVKLTLSRADLDHKFGRT